MLIYFFKISKIPLLDLSALFFCHQATKIRQKKETLMMSALQIKGC
jgi:hypothetical protein